MHFETFQPRWSQAMYEQLSPTPKIVNSWATPTCASKLYTKVLKLHDGKENKS